MFFNFPKSPKDALIMALQVAFILGVLIFSIFLNSMISVVLYVEISNLITGESYNLPYLMCLILCFAVSVYGIYDSYKFFRSKKTPLSHDISRA
jgi:hypothetical protein